MIRTAHRHIGAGATHGRFFGTGVRALGLALTAATLLGACKEKKAPEPAPVEATPEQKPATEKAPEGHAMDGMKLPTLPKVPIPESNPQTDAKIKLGHQLFFDERLSVDGSRACYSCHQNEHGNGGGTPLAVGAKDKQLTRHSPVIWNVGYLPLLYWDGRSDSLEKQAKGAWGGGNMGVGDDKLDAKAKEIGKIAGYKKQFEEVFPEAGATADTVAQAISAYERTLVCEDTAYDKYAAGDKSALTDEQKDGLALFMGKAGCTACHAPPHFSTAYLGQGAFFNAGIGIEGKKEEEVDVGRMAVTKKESDWAAFKPPTLRNTSKSAPYFHDGSVATLEEAVKFMASGGYDNKNKSQLLMDKKLSEQELAQLVAFLKALECGGKLEKPELP